MNLTLRHALLIPIYSVCLLFSVQTVEAATVVNTNITSDTIWTAAGSPYILTEHISVASGVTLTIEAGVVVKLTDTRLITVNGAMVANGTEAEPVYFTSVHDDTVGGDSNQNGGATAPQARDWRALNFKSGSTGNFSHAVIKYAGYQKGGSKPVKAMPAIYNEGGSVTLEDSEISNNNVYGVGQVAGMISIIDSDIDGPPFGGAITGGDTSLVGNTIANNSNKGLYAVGSGSLTLENNTFTNNHTAADVSLAAERAFTHSGNTASGGSFNGIVLRGPISGVATLENGDMPYLVGSGGTLDATGIIIISTENNLTVVGSGTLNLDAGAVVKFGDGSSLQVDGALNALGTSDEPIYFTSLKDDEAGGDTNGDGGASLPAPSDWKQIKFGSGSSGNFDHAYIRYGGARSGSDVTQTGILNAGGALNIENSQIHNNNFYGLTNTTGTATIHNSSLDGHSTFAVWNRLATPLDATNNYWGDPSGPHHTTLNPSGLGDDVSDNVLFEPWLGEWPPAGTQCCSSVLFLPGIMSSRLSEAGEQRWEPEEESDVERLYLDSSGKSVNDIDADEVIGTFDGPLLFNVDIYQSFLEDVALLKDDGTIDDYFAYPYDWRLSYEDILADEALADEVRRLASSSKSAKVTIVAHSNGGLLAKALVNQLGAEATDVIDQMVFVGVPQLGTPKTIASLLHGADAGITFRYSDARGREFAQNAPMSYQLLPHEDYYDNAGVSVSTPLVTFENGSQTEIYTTAYGGGIGDANELRNFILGQEGRPLPAYDDTTNPAIGNSALYNSTESYLSSIGSNWQAPEGIVIHQIAGMGELTLAGINYKTVQECTRRILWHCDEREDKLSYDVTEVIDGDGTVILPSALLMSASTENVKRWWVDLDEYNRFKYIEVPKPDILLLRTKHGDLFEIDDIRSFILNGLIGGNGTSTLEYIGDEAPVISDRNRLSFTLHSPLSLSLTDGNGNLINEDNPDGPHASYSSFGEIQVVNVFGNGPFTLNLDGVTDGSFTLDITEFENDQVAGAATFSAIPSSPETVAKMEFSGGALSDAGALVVDYDGDMTADLELVPEEGVVVGAPEPTVNDLVSYFQFYVNENVMDAKVRNQFIKDIEHFQKMYDKTKAVKVLNPAVFLINLKTKISVYARIGKIEQDVANELLTLLASIEAKI